MAVIVVTAVVAPWLLSSLAIVVVVVQLAWRW
jgi:hypothetical protein